MCKAKDFISQNNADAIAPTAKRVLVVDDEATIREVVAICLERLGGWEVIAVASGQEALQKARSENFDAIVLDVKMPEMDGFTLLQQLRQDPAIRFIPVVLLTANVHLPPPEVLAALGVVRTIAKPFHSLDLVEQVAQTMAL